MSKKRAKRAKNQENPTSSDRRRFLNQALAASAGVAISRLMPHLYALPLPPGCTPSPLAANELVNPGEITSVGTTLRSVLVVHDEKRTVPTLTGQTFTLRAYEGYSGNKIDPAKRVTKPGVYGPGPTFRAKVGDTIQIALLNHINPAQFPETPNGQCDVSTTATGGQIYPSPAPPAPGTDVKPDCFRGSNHTNMHFHGTHVSPNAFSDNVLIEIAPDLHSTPEECDKLFESVACKDYPTPRSWQHQDEETTKALKEYIASNQQRLADLPPEEKDKDLHIEQAKHNEMLMGYSEFPQYWAGCFPYCIRPPKSAPPFTMAQAQGTHWYHAHKHGSTSIQIFNGMAGALILEGDDYDTPLKTVMPGVEQKVLLIQEFAEQPNMERVGAPSVKNPPGIGVVPGGARTTPILLVNGQSNPTITMQTNEVQWWRIINATVHRGKGAYICKFNKAATQGAAIAFRQIAQDGVQFHQTNYASQISRAPINFVLGPANRVDILVKAPGTPGTATLIATGANNDTIVTINVVNGSGCNTAWPDATNFPKQPAFLGDLTAVSETRHLKYEMADRGGVPTINGVTFKENFVNESMLLGTKQEWIIENYSVFCPPTPNPPPNPPPPPNPGCSPHNSGNPLHPFHIHINPFQILEVFDPTGSLKDVLSFNSAQFGVWSKVKFPAQGHFVLPAPWVWWDTFPLPLAASPTKPGWIRFRTWFTDFAGKFVDHCHILAHEDRGMMQLIEVTDNKTPYQHR
jgi:FtsP/CotA-like multicopper oxidase with cupredoxin domain